MKELLQKLLSEERITKEEMDALLAAHAKELEQTKAKYEEMLQEFEGKNYEEQIKELEERIQKAKEEGKAELIPELEKHKKMIEELQEQNRQKEQTIRQFRIANAVRKELGKYKPLDPQAVEELLIHKTSVDEKGNVVFEGEKPLEEGIKSYFEAHPNLLEPIGKGGSGSSGVRSGFADNTLTARLLRKKFA